MNNPGETSRPEHGDTSTINAPSLLKSFWLLRSNILKAIRVYWSEFRYWIGHKRRRVGRPLENLDNRDVLIRKRAHHLERYLFHPELYGEEFGAAMSRELDALLDGQDTMARTAPVRWSAKIASEYHQHERFCPVLAGGAKRRPSRLSPADVLQLIKARRSRRIFLDTPLTAEEKRLLTEAAQYAPSSCNRQTLELVFVEDPELKAFVSKSIPGGHQFFHKAPCVIIMLSDARDYRYPDDRVIPFVDGSSAAQNIYLMCETMGLGCCWGSYFSFGSVVNEREIRRRLRIPESHLIVASLAVGKSEQYICPIPRDDPGDRMHQDFYSAK